jgi:hypothetical protein
LVTDWYMAPVKSKRKDVIESFRKGHLAEPKIHDKIVPFINTKTKGFINVVQVFNAGLIKSKIEHILAVSPDALCILGYTTVGLTDVDDRQ